MRTLRNPFIIKDGQPPLVIAHGGAKKLWPENTQLAFQKSVALGVDALEIDIRMTKDQVLIAHHNDSIEDTSNGHGKIADLYYEELKKFNFGYQFTDVTGNYPYRNKFLPLPLLKELLKTFNDKLLILDLKDEGAWGMRAAEILADMLSKAGAEQRVIVASYHEEVLSHFCSITHDSLPMSASYKEATQFVLFSKSGLIEFFHTRANFLHIPTCFNQLDLSTTELIADAHQQQLAVHYWTINDTKEMRRLIQIGADGIVTDRPDLLLELLKQMGYHKKAA